MDARSGCHCAKARDEIISLRDRLEIDPSHPYDGIYCRDETIRLQDIRIASLNAEVERLREFVDKWTNYKPNKPHQPTIYENCVKTIAPMAAEFAEEARAALTQEKTDV
jgi:hypothetical protein